MAKKLSEGRKAGSGRKPGTAKTLAEGRKVGSGRKKGSVSKTLADGRKIGSGRKRGTDTMKMDMILTPPKSESEGHHPDITDDDLSKNNQHAQLHPDLNLLFHNNNLQIHPHLNHELNNNQQNQLSHQTLRQPYSYQGFNTTTRNPVQTSSLNNLHQFQQTQQLDHHQHQQHLIQHQHQHLQHQHQQHQHQHQHQHQQHHHHHQQQVNSQKHSHSTSPTLPSHHHLTGHHSPSALDLHHGNLKISSLTMGIDDMKHPRSEILDNSILSIVSQTGPTRDSK